MCSQLPERVFYERMLRNDEDGDTTLHPLSTSLETTKTRRDFSWCSGRQQLSSCRHNRFSWWWRSILLHSSEESLYVKSTYFAVFVVHAEKSCYVHRQRFHDHQLQKEFILNLLVDHVSLPSLTPLLTWLLFNFLHSPLIVGKRRRRKKTFHFCKMPLPVLITRFDTKSSPTFIHPYSERHPPSSSIDRISEVRQEAVQQAIAAMKSKPGKAVVPMPSKRSSAIMVLNSSSNNDRRVSRRHPRRATSDSSSDDDDDSTTTGNNDSFSDHNRDKSGRHVVHRSSHHQPDPSSRQALKSDINNFSHKSCRNNFENEPECSSSRPNFLSRTSSASTDESPSSTTPPALPPPRDHSQFKVSQPQHHHDHFRDHMSHQRDRNDRERQVHQQKDKSRHHHHDRHGDRHHQSKSSSKQVFERGFDDRRHAVPSSKSSSGHNHQHKKSHHHHHHHHRDHSLDGRDDNFDNRVDIEVEPVPVAPPRVTSSHPLAHHYHRDQHNISDTDADKKKNNNLVMNNKNSGKKSSSHHHQNILSSQQQQEALMRGSAGSNSGTSSSSSTNEKPPEKPPERISSKKSNNNDGNITLNKLTDVMSELAPPVKKNINNNIHRIQGRSLPPPPDVTVTSSSNGPPLPPRISPSHSGSNSKHPLASVVQQTRHSNTSNSNNSNHSSVTPAPDYDPVYDHDSGRQSHQSNDIGGGEASSNDINDSGASLDSFSMTGTTTRVSAKIQQLLVTLSRPKKRPLPDFYVDDETDLEIAANQQDPSAPKPEGQVMNPVKGEDMSVPGGLPKTLEDALTRYGSATFKAPAVTVLDTTGKVHPAFSYGKLYNRSRKIAYNLLNKVGSKSTISSHSSNSSPAQVVSDSTIKQGDRVALVFPNNDPFGFMCAFYGCLLAGVVPVPIEVPMTRRDAGSTQIGFLLGSCSVSYAITSEACYKGLPKTPTGEMPDFKGWPRMTWLVSENWSKPSKDWRPPPRISEDVPAYIEYTVDKEGSMKGVSVSKSTMMTHCKALTTACNYTEGDIMVSVLDFKRDVGLWHSVLTSILNGMHIVFIPYSLMKVNPSSWMLMITKFKATVGICKSRDLHWGLLATRDHKDVNLSSLRMLLVADGSNPWSLSSCDQFINVFNSRGLKPEALCPCASSPEALTVAVRR